MAPIGGSYGARQSPRVNQSQFAMVPRVDVPRSAFDTVQAYKTTFDVGLLIPFYLDEVLPGDSHRVRCSAFVRTSTPLVPIMDNMMFETFFFFVPMRLVWTNAKGFFGEQAEPDVPQNFLVPQMTSPVAGHIVGSISDYFGIPTVGQVGGAATLTHSSLPHRAYNLIWNEWFRDEDLQDKLVVDLDDGPDSAADYTSVQFRGKRHDYFTSCRPWPAKPSVTSPGLANPAWEQIFTLPGAGAPVTGFAVNPVAPLAGPVNVNESGGRAVSYANYYNDGGNLRVRADAAVSNSPDLRVLVNDIRLANAVQLLQERSARGGSRYAEVVRSHFGVISPDARLQRPEYLGGGRSPVAITPVAQTSATGLTGGSTVLGELAGVGTSVVGGHGFSGSFTEHGFIIGLACVFANLAYQQGMNRLWNRRTKYDFYWPALAHLGEQAVYSREIYADGTAGDLNVFGYQERWAEYKYRPSLVTGRFRSTASSSLDFWHLAQEFSARPVLNAEFILETPPLDRNLAVVGLTQQFLMDALFETRRVRPMPMFSIPGLGPRL